ncbi:MAG: hypothetical protein ACLQBB_14730 [Solirubrobacteraceae bacterium]
MTPPQEPPAVDLQVEESSAEERIGSADGTPGQETLTLNTTCTCGHMRRDHQGLRMEVAGPCLECGCGEFRRASRAPESNDHIIERIRAGLDQVEHLQEIVAGLHPQAGDEVLNREEWLALQRDFCGEELVHSTHLEVEWNGGDDREFAGRDSIGAECSPTSPRLLIRHCRRVMIVSIERVQLYVGVQEAMLVLALGTRPVERWRVLWRGRLDLLAQATGGPNERVRTPPTSAELRAIADNNGARRVDIRAVPDNNGARHGSPPESV